MERMTERFLAGLLLVGLVLAFAPGVRADVTIVTETEVKGAGAAQKATTTQYYTATKMRNEYGEHSVSIIDLDKERMITLMHETKMYFEQSFDDLKKMAEAFKGTEPEYEIEKTKETKKINGYTCQKVIMRVKQMGAETVTESWMTKDIEIDSAITKFLKNWAEKVKDIPHQQQNFEAQQKLFDEGLFPVKTVTRLKMAMGTVTTTQTLTKIKKGDLDDSLFEIPEGYTKPTFGPPRPTGSESKD